jgi:diguanylate cyclase (GGDEF)-like protein/putative nucleotidyltransferase with HDIG domain
MKKLPNKAKAFITGVALSGALIVAYATLHWASTDLTRFLCYVAIAITASSLKVNLPRITGTMSVNFLFILIGIAELSFAETLLMGLSAILVQCLWNTKLRPNWTHVSFNLGNSAVAIGATYFISHNPVLRAIFHDSLALELVVAACVYFVSNTLPVAGIISLTEGQSFKKIWQECYFWSFPYYLVGAAIAGLVSMVNRTVGWQPSLLVVPVVYWIFRSYRLYLGRLEDEKRHAEEMGALHLRTIEALALAIDAKDHTTHDHLRRVRVYAIEIAKELTCCEDDIEALRAASLLHDIGKLAVPEHIISKPGKLSPEEFEKMKIHPVVGAEILERVEFPYPVVPIVRAHHEKWDGSGYPQGLKGEEIPIGARILSAVDCLDALASDRQYRRALPLDEAMARVVADSGKAFDPQVVEILHRRYVELEQLARAQDMPKMAALSKDLKITAGAAPAEGFESSASEDQPIEFLSSIAAARQEAQMLFEVSQSLGNSLSLDETLSVLSVRLKRLVPYDSMAIYVLKDKKLLPEFVSGENFRLFSSLEIPLGEGLSGWVAHNRMPIVNGNPSVEPGYLNDPDKFSTLRSALAVPLEAVNGVTGVLALYRAEKDAFNKDHLRVMLAISSKLAMSIDNALKYQMAENSATTDYLTGLPNARSLFLHLDRELARCKRTNEPLTVLVTDLDGFKQINDRFGHLEGNRTLRVMARGLSEACREYDYVARMGGDEFVIVVPGLTPENLEAKVSQFREIAREAGREICGEEVLSLSVGQAHFPGDGTDAEQLLAQADRRMYVAKQNHYTTIRKTGTANASYDSAQKQLLM